jgi:hypothetical protein
MSGADRMREIAMAICASRLDNGVSAEDFTERVEQLIECARDEGKQLGRLAGSIERIGRRDEPEPAAGTGDEPSSSTESGADLHPGDARSVPAGRRRLSYDDKTRMRERYAVAMEGRQRAPNGFLERMASEYGVSVATVKETLYRGDGT